MKIVSALIFFIADRNFLTGVNIQTSVGDLSGAIV
jgi:hypothetical protein